MPIHVAAKRLRLAELEGAKPAFVHLGSIILPSTALLLDPCTRTNRSVPESPITICTAKCRKISPFI
jgi:hypothetical protein